MKHTLALCALLCATGAAAQQKEYYYENQTRYGTFRHYSNGGSKLVSGIDYAADMARSQEELKRLRAARAARARAEQNGTGSSGGGTRSSSAPAAPKSCEGSCTETIRFTNGNHYTGNTRYGEPHGTGTFTWPATGQTLTGGFRNGQPDGEVVITGKHYVQRGTYRAGKPVGEQRYEYDDGVQKLVEIRNVDNNTSRVEYPDRTSFTGVSDNNGKYLKGRVTYASGIVFEGDFQNGRPWRGTWEKNGRVMIGEFGEANPAELYLKFGYHYDPATRAATYGSYVPGMKRIGYSRSEDAGGRKEFVYGPEETELYVSVQFPSGNRFLLKPRQEGYDYLGTYSVSADNSVSPIIFDKKKGRVDIGPADSALAEKARRCAREVLPAIEAEKALFERNLKSVQPWLDAAKHKMK